MNSFLAQLSRFMPLASAQAVVRPEGVARSLMERAEASAGRDPHRAQELRTAAQAFLSVVR